MTGRERQSGWTLVELLVAAVSAAVLALTAGAMLVFTFEAWQQHLALRAMQDDIQIAGPTICMAIREARNSEVTEPAVGVTGARLTLGRRSIYRANSALAYDPAGALLAYNRDTNANNTMALCQGRVTTFQCTRGTNAISFYLVLKDQGETVSLTNGGVFFRN